MKFIVELLKQKNAGRRLTAIGRTAATGLDPEDGDFIRVNGLSDRATIAHIWPSYPEDQGTDIIRTDGRLCQQAGVGIDERVDMGKADMTPAKRITIALPQNLRIGGSVGTYIRDKLLGQPVTQGQGVQLPFDSSFMSTSDQSVPIKIASAGPDGAVVVTDDIEFQMSQKPVEQISNTSSGNDGGPSVTCENAGGLDKELEQVRETIEPSIRHPRLFKHLGIELPRGMLLYDPPGAGKTLITKAVTSEIDASFHTISGLEVMSKYYGEFKGQLREILEGATENSPAIVFVDEVSSTVPKHSEADGGVECRIVAQLLSLMDGPDKRGGVVIIDTTNHVDAIDGALHRGGRSGRKVEINVPGRGGRKEVMQAHTRDMLLTDNMGLDAYAGDTRGFVEADLESLAKESVMYTLRHIRLQLDLDVKEIDTEALENLKIVEGGFGQTLKSAKSSAPREMLVEVLGVTWKGAGGLEPTRERLRETVQ